jgi:hypothetical protein
VGWRGRAAIARHSGLAAWQSQIDDQLELSQLLDRQIGSFRAFEDAITLGCLVPSFDGAFLSHDANDALWDKYYTAAPPRWRQSVEQYKTVKKA